jgi:hypothetical protein
MTEPWLGLRSKRGTSEKHVRRLHFDMCKLECERVGIFEVVYEYICMPAVPKYPKAPRRHVSPRSVVQVVNPTVSSWTIQENAMLPNTKREVMKRTVITPN